MPAIALLLLKTLGQALLSIVISLITGRTLKRGVVLVGEFLSKKTATQKDDQLVEEAKKDLELDGPKE